MATITLYPIADTVLRSNTPTTNFNGEDLVVGELASAGSYYRTSLLKFDLSPLWSSVVITATLRLYCKTDDAGASSTFSVCLCKRAWVEAEATWNEYSAGNSWETAGGTGANDIDTSAIGTRAFTASETLSAFKEWSLTPAGIYTMRAANNGILIHNSAVANSAYGFEDSSSASNKPELVIEFIPKALQIMVVGL